MIMKGIIAAVPDRKIHVGECMGHLVETDILAVGVIGEFPEKMGPGEIDTVLADMAFERGVVEAKAVSVLYYVDGLEEVEQEMFEPEGELYGGCADQQRHALIGFDVDILEFLRLHKGVCAVKETFAGRGSQAAVIGIVASQQGIETLPLFFEHAITFCFPGPVQ